MTEAAPPKEMKKKNSKVSFQEKGGKDREDREDGEGPTIQVEENPLDEVKPGSTIANCRMYENKYPEVDDLVVVEVKSIEEMGAYVALKEYNDIEGMILLSELSRRRIRSINKIIRVGRLEVVVVLRVDKEKGYIDLSKRRVSDEDIAKCQERYNKSKAVHSIMRHVAETVHLDLEELYGKIAWKLYRKLGHAYDAFKLSLADANILKDLNLEPNIQDAVIKHIKRRLTPQPVKVRADLEVTCFHYEGIDAIKAALAKGEQSAGDQSVKIKLVAPPLYVAVTTSSQKDLGIQQLLKAIDAIKEEITKYRGEVVVKAAPRTVHERDELELQSLLKKLEIENREVGGDDDNSEGEMQD